MRDPTEDELDGWMARLARGDRDAFDPLFRALHPRAVRLARVRLPHDQAADVAQSIMTKVFWRASDFLPGKPLLPWFYAVAANEVRTVERRRGRQARRTVDDQEAGALPSHDDPEKATLERELLVCLEQAIASLDDASAEAIRSMLSEVPLEHVSASAFRKRVSRAYARLRLLMGGLDGR